MLQDLGGSGGYLTINIYVSTIEIKSIIPLSKYSMPASEFKTPRE